MAIVAKADTDLARQARRAWIIVATLVVVTAASFLIYRRPLPHPPYSLIDLLEHILTFTGPADLVISTWTAAGADIDYALRLRDDGRVRSILWLVDSSFPVRQPGYCKAMRDRFGDAAIRVTKNHAKFVLIGNDEWHVVLRTSMNLNENKRLESWEVSDDEGLHSYLTAVVAELFAAPTPLDAGTADTAAYRAFTAETERHRDPHRRIRYVK